MRGLHIFFKEKYSWCMPYMCIRILYIYILYYNVENLTSVLSVCVLYASLTSHFTPNDDGVGCIRDENLKIRRLYGDRGISNFSLDRTSGRVSSSDRCIILCCFSCIMQHRLAIINFINSLHSNNIILII